MYKFLTLLVLVWPLAETAALAQDDIEDLDESGGGKKKSRKEKEGATREFTQEVIREIERGFYGKASVGSTTYLLTYSGGLLKSGTAIALGVGSDFVDNERNSMAWEVAFASGVHNGLRWDQQRDAGVPPERNIQGDTRTLMGLANIEYSIYPNRRIGIGIRAGGGVMMTPLLMNSEAYARDVVTEWGTDPVVHRSPHPLGFGGPTFEYYTKLSHFSIGLDADVIYAVGFDLGVSTVGYMKYTF